MQTFDEINLNKQIHKALIELGFVKPTPIQAKTIPLLMDSSRDLIGSAQTGTGKTAAFGIPSIHLTDLSEKTTQTLICLLYTSPSPRDATLSRMPSSA